jgi:hypothetical protein
MLRKLLVLVAATWVWNKVRSRDDAEGERRLRLPACAAPIE